METDRNNVSRVRFLPVIILLVIAGFGSTSVYRFFLDNFTGNKKQEYIETKVMPAMKISKAHEYIISHFLVCESEWFTSYQECIIRIKELAEIEGYGEQYRDVLYDAGLIGK